MSDIMWAVLCAICFVLGRLCNAPEKSKKPPDAPIDPRTEKQWNNFWAYDGTEGGQVEIED